MRQLQADDQALCQEFNVTSPNTALNMVRELQLILIGLGPQDSPRARHFLEHAMKVFRGRAASNISNADDSSPSLYSQTSLSSSTSARNPRSPLWVISESDIRVDENSPLGRGGFGTVFKGQWNGATVAVKRLVKDASAEVRSLPLPRFLVSYTNLSPLRRFCAKSKPGRVSATHTSSNSSALRPGTRPLRSLCLSTWPTETQQCI
jgi:hypothetical protein